MAERFTPGPWKRDRYNQVVGANGKQIHVANLCIAHVSGGSEPTSEEVANSNVMLAATHMYAELKRVTDHLETFASDHSRDATAETWSAIHSARAALSKAHPTQGDE